MRTLERISQVKAELKFACLFYLHFVSTVARRDKTPPRIQKHVPGEDVFWILERVFGFWKCFVPTSHGNTISPCWWPRPKVFTSVLRTKHSLNANFAKKKLFWAFCGGWKQAAISWPRHTLGPYRISKYLTKLFITSRKHTKFNMPNCYYWRSLILFLTGP